MTADSLRDLLERVERATGPDRELDAAICEGLHSSVCEPEYRGTHHGEPVWRHPDFGLIRCEPYTNSVDASLALIGRLLPGVYMWRLDFDDEPTSHPASVILCWGENGRANEGGATPALALCAALLAAMIEQEGA